jgi:hypothetical protein
MRRRRLLGVLLGGGLLSGCLGRTPADKSGSATAADPTETDEPRTPTATLTTPSTESGETRTSTTASDDTRPSTTEPDAAATVTLERIETFTHALRLNSLGSSPQGEISSVAALGNREREVVTTAIDGTYEVDDPPQWLTTFVSSTPYVERDGQYYSLETDLPRTTITAEAVEESEVSGRIASYDTYEDAVTHDGIVEGPLMRFAQREGVTRTDIWPSLEEFLDTYDAVRYRGRILDFSVTVEESEGPYTVTAERASLDAVAGGPVWRAANASNASRRLVREAGATEGLYPIDDPPAELLEKLDAHQYVTLNGTFYTTYVEKRSSLPVSMSASFPDDELDEDGARIQLTLHNESDERIQVESGAPPPFGVFSYHPVGEPDAGELLWTDAYEESEHVRTDGQEIRSMNSIGLSTPVDAGGTAERTFTIE